MITKRRAALDGVELDSLDSRILIQGTEPGAGREQINSARLWDGSGSRVTNEHRDSLDVVIRYSLDIKPARFQERAAVHERILGWAARGGWLTLSQKPGRTLRVVPAQLPAEGDPLAWTTRYAITFRAFGVPYWQDMAAVAWSATGAAEPYGRLGIPGTVKTVLDAEFVNTGSAAVDSVTLTAGESEFQLEGLGLQPGETLAIDHPDDGRLCVVRIRIKSAGGVWRSAMACRLAESSDDLWVEPGIRELSMTADGAGNLTLRCWGRYA